MSPRVSKKSVIQAWLERHKRECVGRAEAAAIRQELARALGPSARVSGDYLLSVLDQLGVPVAVELRGMPAELYHALHLGTLAAAEATLRLLDERYRKAQAAADRAALEECRRAALLVRSRAERIARNRRTEPAKRAEKEEIARWFAIWLQTPDLFFDWLALRKAVLNHKDAKDTKEHRE